MEQENHFGQQKAHASQKRKMSDVTRENQPLQHQESPRNIHLVRPQWRPGMCAQRLNCYISQMQKRPLINNIEFWRELVAEFFVPNAKKRLCVSQHHQAMFDGVLLQAWNCKICRVKPRLGFESTADVMPMLLKTKYESGIREELLHLVSPREILTKTGLVLLICERTTQETVSDEVRMVHSGQLRVLFSSNLKIFHWEFCVQHHDELISKRRIMPSANLIERITQMFLREKDDIPAEELKRCCRMLRSSANQIMASLSTPPTYNVGYPKGDAGCHLHQQDSLNHSIGNAVNTRNPLSAPDNLSIPISLNPSTRLIQGTTESMRNSPIKDPSFSSTSTTSAQPISPYVFSGPTALPSIDSYEMSYSALDGTSYLASAASSTAEIPDHANSDAAFEELVALSQIDENSIR